MVQGVPSETINDAPARYGRRLALTSGMLLARLKSPVHTGSGEGWRETFWLSALIILVPTAAYIIIAERFGFLLPRLNFDFPLIYILTVLIARLKRSLAVGFAIVATALVLGVQILFGLGVIYIDDPALVREYLDFITVWPWRLISFWLGIGLAGLVLLYFLLKRVAIERARIAPVIGLFLCLLAADGLGRLAAGHALIGTNPVTSSTSRTVHLINALRTKPRFQVVPLAPEMMRDQLVTGNALPSRILSISVEAYGLAKAPEFNEAVLAPLRQAVAGHYEVIVGSHASKGPTLSGELRELCGERTIGTPTQADSVQLAPRCAPAFLKRQGYENLALHGNSGLFYNRYQLYPALGFDHSLFFSDLRSGPNPAPLCRRRAFEGVCDENVLKTALRFLGEKPLRYAHIMTLDTHFPLGPYLPNDQKCGRVAGLEQDDLCLYANQFSAVLGMYGRNIVSAANPPEVVYLFGDHPPPYVVAEERNFFLRDQVPFITLRRISPKSDSA